MDSVSISINMLREKISAALKQKGASQEDVDAIIDDYFDAEVRGRLSHGLVAIDVALNQFPKKGTYSIQIESDSLLKIDGNGDNGHVVARKAIDMAAGKTAKSGFTAIGISDITRFNSTGSIARYAGEKGLIGVVLEYGGMNFMSAPGSGKPVVSTNPIGIAIPVEDGPMFVLDIATSQKAVGFVGLAKLMEQKMPADWAVDKDGVPTDDPAKLSATVPFGGYKGFGLSMAFEILSGILVGVPVGTKGNLAKRGALILLIEPTAFGVSKEDFAKNVTAFLSEVTVEDGTFYPGQKSEALRNAAFDSGFISLPKKVVQKLEASLQTSLASETCTA